MRLVRRRPAGAELLEGEHQLHGIEQADDAGELRRGQAPREADELGSRHVDVDEHLGQLGVRELHRLGGHLEVEPVGDHEAVDHVELVRRPAVEPGDDPGLDDKLGCRVVRPVGRHEPELRMWRDEDLAPQRAPIA